MDSVTRVIHDVGPDMTLEQVIQLLLNTAIAFAAVVSVTFLIINGYKYMTSGGDSGKTEEAQKGLGNAVIGLIICIAAALIVNFVLNLFGMEAGSLS